mmetsp:Transcript_112634/g.273525  ORF Transcript_112634/g.273525 Transcript_112634/m.273525 type:complete len:211 (-) Transcript_112634:109-741(-)
MASLNPPCLAGHAAAAAPATRPLPCGHPPSLQSPKPSAPNSAACPRPSWPSSSSPRHPCPARRSAWSGGGRRLGPSPSQLASESVTHVCASPAWWTSCRTAAAASPAARRTATQRHFLVAVFFGAAGTFFCRAWRRGTGSGSWCASAACPSFAIASSCPWPCQRRPPPHCQAPWAPPSSCELEPERLPPHQMTPLGQHHHSKRRPQRQRL